MAEESMELGLGGDEVLGEKGCDMTESRLGAEACNLGERAECDLGLPWAEGW